MIKLSIDVKENALKFWDRMYVGASTIILKLDQTFRTYQLLLSIPRLDSRISLLMDGFHQY